MCPTTPDARSVRTRNRLRSALLDLLLTRSWDDISVADVVTHARCSRSTFHAHYEDRDALLADAFVGAMQIVPPTGDGDPLAFVSGLFKHLDRHRVLAEPYLVQGHGGPMVLALRERIATNIRQALDSTAPNLAAIRRAEVAAALGGAVWAVVLWWLEEGRDVPQDDVTRVLVALLGPGLRRLTQS